jgi:hypothetical protein
MRRFFQPASLAVAAAIVGLASPSIALAQHAAKDKAHDPDGEEVAAVAGQQAANDPATGRLRQPTREEAKALAEALKDMVNQSTEGLTVVQHADGTKSVDLQDRFQSVSVAKVSDGAVETRCVTSAEEAKEFLESAPQPKAQQPALEDR